MAQGKFDFKLNIDASSYIRTLDKIAELTERFLKEWDKISEKTPLEKQKKGLEELQKAFKELIKEQKLFILQGKSKLQKGMPFGLGFADVAKLKNTPVGKMPEDIVLPKSLGKNEKKLLALYSALQQSGYSYSETVKIINTLYDALGSKITKSMKALLQILAVENLRDKLLSTEIRKKTKIAELEKLMETAGFNQAEAKKKIQEIEKLPKPTFLAVYEKEKKALQEIITQQKKKQAEEQKSSREREREQQKILREQEKIRKENISQAKIRNRLLAYIKLYSDIAEKLNINTSKARKLKGDELSLALAKFKVEVESKRISERQLSDEINKKNQLVELAKLMRDAGYKELEIRKQIKKLSKLPQAVLPAVYGKQKKDLADIIRSQEKLKKENLTQENLQARLLSYIKSHADIANKLGLTESKVSRLKKEDLITAVSRFSNEIKIKRAIESQLATEIQKKTRIAELEKLMKKAGYEQLEIQKKISTIKQLSKPIFLAVYNKEKKELQGILQEHEKIKRESLTEAKLRDTLITKINQYKEIANALGLTEEKVAKLSKDELSISIARLNNRVKSQQIANRQLADEIKKRTRIAEIEKLMESAGFKKIEIERKLQTLKSRDLPKPVFSAIYEREKKQLQDIIREQKALNKENLSQEKLRERLLSYIKAHKNIADRLGITEASVSKLNREELTLTIARFLNERRIEKSIENQYNQEIQRLSLFNRIVTISKRFPEALKEAGYSLDKLQKFDFAGMREAYIRIEKAKQGIESQYASTIKLNAEEERRTILLNRLTAYAEVHKNLAQKLGIEKEKIKDLDNQSLRLLISRFRKELAIENSYVRQEAETLKRQKLLLKIRQLIAEHPQLLDKGKNIISELNSLTTKQLSFKAEELALDAQKLNLNERDKDAEFKKSLIRERLSDTLRRDVNLSRMLGITEKDLYKMSLKELKNTEQIVNVKLRNQNLDIKRQTIINRIMELYHRFPSILKRAGIQLESIKNKSEQDLRLNYSKLRVFAAQESGLYRIRLEMDRIGRSMMFYGTAVLSSTMYATRNTLEWVNSMIKAQGALQTTNRETFALYGVASALDIQILDLSRTINNSYQALINAGQGTSFVAERVKEALAEVGLSATKLGEDMGDSVEVFFKVIEALNKLEQRYGRAWVLQKVFGSGAEEVASLLNVPIDKLREIYKAYYDMYAKLGIDLEEVKKKGIAVNNMMTQMRMLFTVKFADVLPGIVEGLKKVMDVVVKLLNAWNNLSPAIKNAIGKFIILSAVLSMIIGKFTVFASFVLRLQELLQSNFGKVILSMSGRFMAFASSMGLAVPIFGILIAALGALSYIIHRNNQNFKKLTDSVKEQSRIAKENIKDIQALNKEYSKWRENITRFGTTQEIENFNKKLKVVLTWQERYNKAVEKHQELTSRLNDLERKRESIGLTKQERRELKELWSQLDSITYQEKLASEIVKSRLKVMQSINSVAVERNRLNKQGLDILKLTEIKLQSLDASLAEQYVAWKKIQEGVKNTSKEYKEAEKKIEDVIKKTISEAYKIKTEYNKTFHSVGLGYDKLIELNKKWENVVEVGQRSQNQDILRSIREVYPYYTELMSRLRLEAEIKTSENILEKRKDFDSLYYNYAKLTAENFQKKLLSLEEKYAILRKEAIKNSWDFEGIQNWYKTELLKLYLTYRDNVIEPIEQGWKKVYDTAFIMTDKERNLYKSMTDFIISLYNQEADIVQQVSKLRIDNYGKENELITQYKLAEIGLIDEIIKKENDRASVLSLIMKKYKMFIQLLEKKPEIKAIKTLSSGLDSFADKLKEFAIAVSDDIGLATEKIEEFSKSIPKLFKTMMIDWLINKLKSQGWFSRIGELLISGNLSAASEIGGKLLATVQSFATMLNKVNFESIMPFYRGYQLAGAGYGNLPFELSPEQALETIKSGQVFTKNLLQNLNTEIRSRVKPEEVVSNIQKIDNFVQEQNNYFTFNYRGVEPELLEEKIKNDIERLLETKKFMTGGQ